MQQTIAKGEEARRIEVGNSTSLYLDYQVVHAIWVRSGGNNAWMLTGFRIRVPGGQKEGFDSKKPTQTATTPARDCLGASTGGIVADNSDDGNAGLSRAKLAEVKTKAVDLADKFMRHTGRVSL